MTTLTEADVEQAALAWLEGLGWGVVWVVILRVKRIEETLTDAKARREHNVATRSSEMGT